MAEGFGFDIDSIHLGDALQLMPRIPSGTIDLVVTDPPFAIDFKARKGNYNRSGDRVLKGYHDIPKSEYLSFTETWMREGYRVLPDTGTLYVFSGWNQLKDVLAALESTGFEVINHIIWKYQFGVYTKKKYVTSHYHLLFAVKDPRAYTFNKVEHYPEDVWIINREYWKGKIKTPTKLPLKLVNKIIRFSSNPGDVILDPFIGSGTVAVASRMLGRHYLGFEIVEDYYLFAKNRLQTITVAE
jgi:site-specific DNA-methyltransferase (adenine-specific)